MDKLVSIYIGDEEGTIDVTKHENKKIRGKVTEKVTKEMTTLVRDYDRVNTLEGGIFD